MDLPVTGLYDRNTEEFMKKSRCGEIDISRTINRKTFKKLEYTYFVTQWSTIFPISRQDLILRNGFHYWRYEVKKYLHIHWNKTDPDITISFVKSKYNSLYILKTNHQSKYC